MSRARSSTTRTSGRTPRALLAAVVAATTAGVALTASGSPAAADSVDAPTAPRTFQEAVARPAGFVTGIAVTGSKKTWALGSTDADGPLHAVTARWNGKKWRDIANKKPKKAVEYTLSGGDAIGPKDVWGAGYSVAESGAVKTLVERWNGKKWKIVKSRNQKGSSFTSVSGVSAVSPDDVWTVGTYLDAGGANRVHLQHWDGTRFKAAKFPEPAGAANALLTSVSAVAADDVWAAGAWQDASTGAVLPLLGHWDGSEWTLVPSPAQANPMAVVWSISASSASDAWAVGYTYTAEGVGQTLVLHWDGSDWTVADSPDGSPVDNGLFGVTALSSTDAWAVGTYYDAAAGYLTLALHWDGSVWSIVDSPSDGAAIASYLWGVAGVDSSHVFAIGYSMAASGSRTLLGLGWDGSGWSMLG